MTAAADNTHSSQGPVPTQSRRSGLAAGPRPGRVLRVPARFGSIQRAIWAALPGDTILVSAGVYRETVHIQASKERLALVASGNVLLDARPAVGAQEPRRAAS